MTTNPKSGTGWNSEHKIEHFQHIFTDDQCTLSSGSNLFNSGDESDPVDIHWHSKLYEIETN